MSLNSESLSQSLKEPLVSFCHAVLSNGSLHHRNMSPRLLILLTFDLFFFSIFYEIVLQVVQRLLPVF